MISLKIRMIKSDFFRIHNKIDSKNVEMIAPIAIISPSNMI